MKKTMLMLGLLVCALVVGSVAEKVVASGKSDSLKEEVSPDVAHIQSALQALAPYIYQNKKKRILFDISGAEEAGVSEEYIEFGEELVSISNSIVSRRRIKKEALERFAPYFSYIADNGAPFKTREKRLYKHCGSKENPNLCPPRKRYNVCFVSRSALVQHLVNNGFHKTADYSSTIIFDNYNDYTKPINVCTFGVFRTQARIGRYPIY